MMGALSRLADNGHSHLSLARQPPEQGYSGRLQQQMLWQQGDSICASSRLSFWCYGTVCMHVMSCRFSHCRAEGPPWSIPEQKGQRRRQPASSPQTLAYPCMLLRRVSHL